MEVVYGVSAAKVQYLGKISLREFLLLIDIVAKRGYSCYQHTDEFGSERDKIYATR